MEPNDPNNPWNNNPYSPGQNPNQPNPNQQNPYQQNPYQQNPGQFPPPPPQNPNPFFQNPFFGGQVTMPNAQTILVLGICSIVFAFCYGIVGLILGIIGFTMSSKAQQEYAANPGMYTEASVSNLKAGRICSIIGLSLGALILLVVILELIFLSSMIGSIRPFHF